MQGVNWRREPLSTAPSKQRGGRLHKEGAEGKVGAKARRQTPAYHTSMPAKDW